MHEASASARAGRPAIARHSSAAAVVASYPAAVYDELTADDELHQAAAREAAPQVVHAAPLASVRGAPARAASAEPASSGATQVVPGSFALRRATADDIPTALHSAVVRTRRADGRPRAPARYSSFSNGRDVCVGAGVGFARALAGFIELPYERTFPIPGYGGHVPRTRVLLQAQETGAVRPFPSEIYRHPSAQPAANS